MRIDDMGVALAVNEACMRTYRQGIAKSVEVIVPGPWFLDAVRRLKEEPDLDVGVHLTLTSEWERVKWRPVTGASSLTDQDGYFYPMTSQRQDFPPKTGFLQGGFKLDEVEKELRAQIDTLKRYIPWTSHLSAHMGAAMSNPELRALTQKLAKEYNLKLEFTGQKGFPGLGSPDDSMYAKETKLLKSLEELQPGDYISVEHPGLDTEEMRAIGHKGYEQVAQDRAGVTFALTSSRAKEVIKRRGIKLISYKEL